MCSRPRSTPGSGRAQEHTFAEKMLSAMRLGFGGHVEGHEPIDPKPKPNGSQNSPAAQHAAE